MNIPPKPDEDNCSNPSGAELRIILGLLGASLLMIVAGVVFFPSQRWLIAVGLTLAGIGVYGIGQEFVGLLIDALMGRGLIFLCLVIAFFGVLIVNGYWLLTSP